MKLCSFQLTVKKTFKNESDKDILSQLKKNCPPVKLEKIYSDPNKNDFNKICLPEDVIYYYTEKKCECFFTALGYNKKNEGLVEVFVFVRSKTYESVLRGLKHRINKILKKDKIKLVEKIDPVNIYLVDESGIKNIEQRLKSEYSLPALGLKKRIIILLHCIAFTVLTYFLYKHWHDPDEFLKNTLFSSDVSLFASFVLLLINNLIRPRKLKIDFAEIWENIIPSKHIKFEYTDKDISLNKIDFNLKRK